LAAGLGLVTRPGHSAQDQKAGKDPLDGTWTGVAISAGGKQLPEEQVKRLRLTFAGAQVTVSLLRKTTAGTITLDNAKEPRRFDRGRPGEQPTAVISRRGTATLPLSSGEGGEPPARFDAPPGPNQVLMVLRREPVRPDAPPEGKKPAGPASAAAARAQSQNN